MYGLTLRLLAVAVVEEIGVDVALVEAGGGEAVRRGIERWRD